MPHRTVLVLLLASLSFPLMAKDVRQLGPNGGGGCSDDLAQADGSASPAKNAAAPAARPHPAAKPRPAASHGGDGGSDLRPPRWHSFLPGMFR